MATFEYPANRLEILRELLEEFNEAVGTSENCILDLEHDPGNMAHLRALFRSVHTTKGNLAIVGLTPMIGVMQAMEDVLDLVRNKKIPFSTLVGDVVLLLLDRVKEFIFACHEHQQAEYEPETLEVISTQISRLATASHSERTALLNQLVGILAPDTVVSEPTPDASLSDRNAQVIPPTDTWMVVLQDEDLAFLFEQARLSEHRTRFWYGRTERLVRLMLTYNQMADSGVPDEELVAALLAHDIAMAYTPLHILNKEAGLTPAEQARIHQHIHVGYSLLTHLDRFPVARQIILEHHERPDGLGYPKGLRENQIHPGACMMSIAHAYESISHGQTATTLTKRPRTRAVAELTRNAGTQFSLQWLVPFQQLLESGEFD